MTFTGHVVAEGFHEQCGFHRLGLVHPVAQDNHTLLEGVEELPLLLVIRIHAVTHRSQLLLQFAAGPAQRLLFGFGLAHLQGRILTPFAQVEQTGDQQRQREKEHQTGDDPLLVVVLFEVLVGLVQDSVAVFLFQLQHQCRLFFLIDGVHHGDILPSIIISLLVITASKLGLFQLNIASRYLMCCKRTSVL